MRNRQAGSSGFRDYASRQKDPRSQGSRTSSDSRSKAEFDNNLNAVFDSNLLSNLKGVKAELRYQQTLGNIAQTYHSSRDLLMGSEVVTYWAVLHYAQRTLLDCYSLWRRLTRKKVSKVAGKSAIERAVDKWRTVAKNIGIKILIRQRTEDRLRESVQYAETNLAKAVHRIRELEAQLSQASNNQELEYKVEDLERELRMQRKQNEKLLSEIDLLKSELARVTSQVSKAESRARQQEDRADKLESSLGRELASLKAQLKDETARATRAQKERERAEHQEEVQRQRANELSRELEELRRRMKNNENDQDELRELRAKLRDETTRANRAEKRVPPLQAEIDDLKRQLHSLEQSLSKSPRSGDMDKLRRELQICEREKESAQRARATAEDKLEESNMERDRMGREVERLRREIDELRRLLEKKLAQKDVTIGDQEQTIRDLRRQLAELQRRLDALEGAGKRRAEDDEATSKRAMGKALNRWLERTLTRALNSWRDEAGFRRRTLMALHRIALRWKKNRLYKSFSKLRDYAEAIRIKELEFQAYYTRQLTPSHRRQRG